MHINPVSKSREIALFNFEGTVARRGCSSAGRASALHAEGQEFDPPHLHQELEKQKQKSKEKKIRAHSSGG